LKPLFDHFSIIAPIYERFIHPQDPTKLRSLIPDILNGVLLDAGGGTGRVSQFLHDKAAHIIVADGSLEMLRKAIIKDGIQPVLSRTEGLPFQNDTFDCIIMVDALHHVDNQSDTAFELWRVLKPGGRLIIEEPNIHFTNIKLLALAEKLALMQSHFLTPEKISQLFDLDGSNVSIEYEDQLAWICIEKKHIQLLFDLRNS
jgi:demethylmenaquinone methyltransferase/2-methoxy-6-polyprenyl-1,4-benzoquinol methylase